MGGLLGGAKGYVGPPLKLLDEFNWNTKVRDSLSYPAVELSPLVNHAVVVLLCCPPPRREPYLEPSTLNHLKFKQSMQNL